jgi:hypothetical protein
MAWPTPKVSIAFDDGPYVASPTWTDITEYVYSANVSRGRSDDYSQFIGTAQVVLNNNSRLFDPFNTAGTYYGKLLPRRQIKIEGISNSVTYSVFRGFVDGFPAAWDQAGKFATTTLSCFDAISLISAELLPDYVYDYTKSLSPYNYWRMNDPLGSTTITDVGSKPSTLSQYIAGGEVNTITSTDSLAPSLLSKAANFNGGNYRYNQATTPVASSATVSFWASYSGNISGGYIILQNSTLPNTGSSRLDFQYQTVGTGIGVQARYTALSPGQKATVSNDFGNSNAHHYAFTWSEGGGLQNIYIDGVSQSMTSSGTFYSGAPYPLPVDYVEITGLTIQDWATFPSVLTTDQINDLYRYGAGMITETSAARMTRLLGYTSLDASLKSITASPVASVSQISPPGSNLVAEMQLVNNSEDGDLFVTRAGVVKFTDRNYVYTNTTSNTSQATFAAGSIPFEPSVQINYDAQAIRNDITVTFSGGGQTSTTNTASVTAYGTNAMNTQTQLSTQTQAVTLAAYEATVNGQLLTNISPLSVGVTAVTADWTTLMQLDLLDRYTLTVQPPSGNSISQTELINRIEHRIVPGQWQMTVDGSARYTAWFILDKSTLDGPDLLQ